MGRMRRAVAAACALVSSGCSLPERDNPNDPQNDPHAELRVMDRGVARETDDTCPGLTSGEEAGWSEVLVGTRGGCFVLDARGSFAPRGRSLTLGFERLDADGNPVGEPIIGEGL